MREYFEIPSMSGFSGYRSGGFLVHLVFSAAVVFATGAVVEGLLDWPRWATPLAAFPLVTLLWGVGCSLGGGEPGLLFILALAAIIAGGIFSVAWLLAMVAATVFHFILSMLLPRAVTRIEGR